VQEFQMLRVLEHRWIPAAEVGDFIYREEKRKTA
jgi:hypothetical protein